jgi:spore germination protein YaaH
VRTRLPALVLAVTALALSSHMSTPVNAAADHSLVLGYYVPYDATAWASLEAHPEQLDVVAGQWVNIDACGGLSSRDDQTLKQFAHAHGLKIEPSLFTLSAGLNHLLFTDDTSRSNAIQNIVDYTVSEDYDGFDIDLENVDPDDRAAFSDFVGDLASTLHAQGKLVTIAVPAKERDITTGWAGAFDYAALGSQVDLVTLMAYEYRGPFSGPGSVAPFDWVRRVTDFAARQIPADKLLLGLAFYGYDWNTSSGGAVSVGYPRAVALADHFQAEPSFDAAQQSLTFGYTSDPADRLPLEPLARVLNHTTTSRAAPACEVPPPASLPAPTPAPPPPAGVPQTHEVWVEDSASVAARLALAFNYRIRGVAAWRLGLEDPGVWSVLDQWRSADQGV